MSNEQQIEVKTSVRMQIVELHVGETFTKSRYVTTDELENLLQIKSEMRNNISTQVTRATKKTGQTYAMTTGEMITQTGAVFAILVVQRTS
jgi:hypothetical protein